jgi:hypothetical protein
LSIGKIGSFRRRTPENIAYALQLWQFAGRVFVNFKHLRKTKHTRHPVDNARGNAEVLVAMKEGPGLKISWE